MNEEIKAEFIKELKNDMGGDFIRNNPHRLNKDELVTICVEVLYATYDKTTTRQNKNILEAAAKELEERL